jgi:cytochrome c-type biogenesis protein CcmF
MATLGFLMSWWIVFAVATDVVERVRVGVAGTGRLIDRLRMVPRTMWGMWLAHLGVAAFAFGVSMVNTYGVERDVKMEIGDTVEIAGYVFTYRGVRDVEGPNYTAARGLVEVTRNGKPVTTMQPEKRIYRVQQNPMTEAAINTGFTRDLYVSLGEPVGDKAWIVRVYFKPFVDWIWCGCLLMAIGGGISATDRRYRATSRSRANELSSSATVAP